MQMSFKENDLIKIIELCIAEQIIAINEKELNLKNKIKLDTAPCLCDQSRIVQVIANILANSIKFSPHKGNINISLSLITNSNKNSYYQITISDQGSGIPKDSLTKVFSKFYQTKESASNYKGTGLGLAICKEIVDLHRGKIWAKNNTDMGCRIIIEIPK